MGESPTTRADETEVREWYERWPDANVGIVTGAMSSLVVLDVDRKVSLDLLLCGSATRCRPPLCEDEVGRTVDSIAWIHAEESEDSDASSTA